MMTRAPGRLYMRTNLPTLGMMSASFTTCQVSGTSFSYSLPCSACVSVAQGLIGTLDMSKESLELSQHLLGPAHVFPHFSNFTAVASTNASTTIHFSCQEATRVRRQAACEGCQNPTPPLDSPSQNPVKRGQCPLGTVLKIYTDPHRPRPLCSLPPTM